MLLWGVPVVQLDCSAILAWSGKEDAMQNVGDGKIHEPGQQKCVSQITLVLLQSVQTWALS